MFRPKLSEAICASMLATTAGVVTVRIEGSDVDLAQMILERAHAFAQASGNE